jgi:putative sterol carrier protein
MKLFSEEWAQGLEEALNADPKFQKASRKRTDTLRFRVEGGGGDGSDVVYHLVLNKGETQVKLGDPGDADATFSMDLDSALKMSQGKLNGQQATMAGKLKADLPMPKLIALAPVLDARQKVEKTLPIEA